MLTFLRELYFLSEGVWAWHDEPSGTWELAGPAGLSRKKYVGSRLYVFSFEVGKMPFSK